MRCNIYNCVNHDREGYCEADIVIDERVCMNHEPDYSRCELCGSELELVKEAREYLGNPYAYEEFYQCPICNM